MQDKRDSARWRTAVEVIKAGEEWLVRLVEDDQELTPHSRCNLLPLRRASGYG